jgi:PBP1b-binding outer membrane lipoprotein LpoB
MKKLTVYASLLAIVLVLTACENRTVNNPNPPTRDRTAPQNPNEPPSDQIQR